MLAFEHLDNYTRDDKVYLEEYRNQLRTLSNVCHLELKYEDFKSIKTFERAYFNEE